ncbi:Gal_Lectin domain-containing protein, partial [Cephalotus follicularis]
WTYHVGLKGEELGVFSGSSSDWVSESLLPIKQPLIWYKTTFDDPVGNDPIALDLTGLRKGEAWVNKHRIGRYWPTYIVQSNDCTHSCNYRGAYGSSKCLKNWGKPSQQLYHVPRPILSLECPLPNQVLSSIKFASFGTPDGTCGSFSHGHCKSSRALSFVQKACIGSKSCNIRVSTHTFG